ncbi:MAG: PAS domain S-box protein [Pseudomonadota bacterium]
MTDRPDTPDVVYEELAALRQQVADLQVRERQFLAASRQGDETFRRLVEQAPSGICFVRGDGRLDYINDRFVQLFGYTLEDLPDLKSWWSRAFPDETCRRRAIEYWEDATQRSADGDIDIAPIERNVTCKDGSLRTVEAGWVGLDEGFLATFTDVTARRAAEQRANEHEVKVSAFLDNTRDLVTAVDAHGRFTYVNRVAEEFLGVPPEDLPGRSAFDFIHPEDRESTQEAFAGWVAARETHVSWENRQVSLTGEVRHFLWTIMPRYEDGALESIWSIARDITAIKAVEAELLAVNKSLLRSNRDLEQFAYVASHDLQEPLRMVASYTQLLAENYAGKLDSRADKYINFAVEGANRMHSLLRDLLEFAQVDSRGAPFSPTDCGAVVAEVLDSLETTIQRVGAEVVVTGTLPRVYGNKIQLRQVFQNLIANALKFTGEAPPRVEITARKVGNLWEITVADNGIGIEPQFHDRIFTIFQRLHSRATYPGTGIGLAIVKKIVEHHGGTICVDSAPRGGSALHLQPPRPTGVLSTHPPLATASPAPPTLSL